MAEQSKVLALLDQEKPNILAMVPVLGDWMTPERWFAIAYDIAKSPALQNCSPASVVNALIKFASWGLVPDGEEGVIVPYKNEATAQPMVRGLIRRAIDAGAISHAVADIIKEGDDVEIQSGTAGRVLVHKPAFNSNNGKRPIIGAYAVITMPNGSTDFELFEQSDIEAVKKASMRITGGKASPAWEFFEGEMVKKSVLRRALKRFRGKRDSVAGQAYNSLITADTRFDAETTGEPVPDDLPQPAADTPAAGAGKPSSNPPSATLKGRPTQPAPEQAPDGPGMTALGPSGGNGSDEPAYDLAAQEALIKEHGTKGVLKALQQFGIKELDLGKITKADQTMFEEVLQQ